MTLAAAAVLYFAVINLGAYFAYFADKRRAQLGLRRTPESSLLMLGLFGGSPGAFAAQEIYRHKTRKASFRLKFWLIVAIQLAIAIGAMVVVHNEAVVQPSSSSSP